MNEIPLSDACFSEVLARVTFRWIHYIDRKHNYPDLTPKERINVAGIIAERNGFKTINTWCLAYALAWLPLYQTRTAREGFILRARQGCTWRSVAFPAYKSHRRDPRVTNRGVASDDLIGNL